MKKVKSFFMTAIVLLGLPASANALGFGVPVLKSHLNEILDVRVPLLLMEGESLNSVFVEFAKPNEYRLVGLEPYTDLSGMRISIEHMKHGELYVMVSSVSVIQAPIISLLLKARIGHNTYYKQVQILLDTMELGARTHAVVAKQKSQSTAMTEAISKSTAGVEQQGWARTWRYGPVRSGDSLSTIAYRLRRDKQWSNHDVMLALYRFNPSAFIEHDINRLKSGVWLEIPHEKTLKELLKQAPKAYENLKRTLEPSSKKIVKPVVKLKTILREVKQANVTSQLRYVGRIALGKGEPASPSESEISSGKDSTQLQEKLNQLYQQAMDDHLQMASLDQNIMAIRDDIGKLSHDIVALKEQQNMMRQQMVESPSSQYWMQGFLLLVLLNTILLGLFLYNRYHIKKKEKYDIEEVYFKKKSEDTLPVEEPASTKKKVRKKHLLENKIYDIENYLNLRDYESVENILKQLSQGERDHFAVCALKARLYHETGRLDERDALIRNKQESLSDRQWHLLCDRLPINLWHALHESGVIQDHGTLVSVEEGSTHHQNADIFGAGVLSADTVMMDEAQLSDIVARGEGAHSTTLPVEPTGLSALSSEVIDINDGFLELNDNELKGVDDEQQSSTEQGSDVLEDEFVSTVFVSTLDGKKKLR